MPAYKPQSETMQSNSTQSGQEIDNDYSITSILYPTVSTRPQRLIKLSVNGSLEETSFISGNETKNITTLSVTIRIK